MLAGNDFGREKDGTPSHTYCSHCYNDGEFTNNHLTLAGMKTTMRVEMEREHTPPGIIEKVINLPPTLKRWRAS